MITSWRLYPHDDRLARPGHLLAGEAQDFAQVADAQHVFEWFNHDQYKMKHCPGLRLFPQENQPGRNHRYWLDEFGRMRFFGYHSFRGTRHPQRRVIMGYRSDCNYMMMGLGLNPDGTPMDDGSVVADPKLLRRKWKRSSSG